MSWAKRTPSAPCRLPCTTITAASSRAALRFRPLTTVWTRSLTMTWTRWSSPSPTSCCSVPPVPARRCWPRRSRASSRCRLPSPMPPRSPRLVTLARTWRISCSSSSMLPMATLSALRWALSTWMRLTRSPARPRTSPLLAMSQARAFSRRCLRFLRARWQAFRPPAAASIPSRSCCRSTRLTSCLSVAVPL